MGVVAAAPPSRRVARGEADPLAPPCACWRRDGGPPGGVVLLYEYAAPALSDAGVERLAEAQRALGARLGMVGKVRVGREGVNLTAAGRDAAAVDAYVRETREMLQRPAEADFKLQPGCEHLFEGFSVRVVDEICPLGEAGLEPAPAGGAGRLAPEAFHAALDEGSGEEERPLVVDVRNWYESRIGRFEGALCTPLRRFGQLPGWVQRNRDLFAGRKVMLYCTGGVRCEKAATLVRRETDAKEVCQLEGGIAAYARDVGPENSRFRGANFVFDARGAVPVTQEPVAWCDGCFEPAATLAHCRSPGCYVILTRCERCPEVSCCASCEEQAAEHILAVEAGRPPPRRRPCECDSEGARERRLGPPPQGAGRRAKAARV